MPDTANTKVAAIYSSHEIEFGSINCSIYIDSKEKKKAFIFCENKPLEFHFFDLKNQFLLTKP